MMKDERGFLVAAPPGSRNVQTVLWLARSMELVWKANRK